MAFSLKQAVTTDMLKNTIIETPLYRNGIFAIDD